MFESGMEILRADFHLHTKADKEFKYNGEENSYINNYIDELFAQGIRVAVLTNHNKFDMEEYKALKRKAAKKDILILPGVELSVKEGSNGVHTLIIFDPDSWIENGNNHIAWCNTWKNVLRRKENVIYMLPQMFNLSEGKKMVR